MLLWNTASAAVFHMLALLSVTADFVLGVYERPGDWARISASGKQPPVPQG
ncbi:Uncharacterised protein [Comamonas testosteroni]|uniref:Uncharacterized protein n=1 Tax=Comamonas testosteroni TaxID=285 RepID=A0A8B4S944_COMTE|nr:hypothetical protein CTATCC11996_09587 [Comamonas testosteroni ATCC 11996]SUY79491.1 Uncharacterised protein [Comamonas testosteroni]